MDLEKCNGNCTDEFDTCKMDNKANCMDEGNTTLTRKQCKRQCKNNRKACKKACNAATKCPACEDINDIIGFGTPSCEDQVASATFCDSADGANKCKKTCELCG